MEWTKEAPAEKGYYWAYSSGVGVEQVYVWDYCGDLLGVAHSGNSSVPLFNWEWWQGPLEIPQPPTPAHGEQG